MSARNYEILRRRKVSMDGIKISKKMREHNENIKKLD